MLRGGLGAGVVGGSGWVVGRVQAMQCRRVREAMRMIGGSEGRVSVAAEVKQSVCARG